MKKTILLLLFSFVSINVFAASAISDLNFTNGHILDFKIKTGELRMHSEFIADTLHERYSLPLANFTRTEGEHLYDVFRYPIAISGSLPKVNVNVSKTVPAAHKIKNTKLYSISEPQRYRDQDFVILSINPFLANNMIAAELWVQVDLGKTVSARMPEKFDRIFLNSEYAAGLKASKIKPVSLKKNSPGFNGNWLDVTVDEEGIFVLEKSELLEKGISGSINDDQVYLYAGPGFGSHLRDEFPDSSDFHLKQVPLLYLQGNSDNEDQWVFYASKPSAWERQVEVEDIRYHEFKTVPYGEQQHFRLFVGSTTEAPLRMQQSTPVFDGSEQVVDYFYQRYHYENELINPGKGGELWLGEKLRSNSTFPFYLNNLYTETTLPAYIRLAVGQVSKGTTRFDVYAGSSKLGIFSDTIGSDSDDLDKKSQIVTNRQYRFNNTILSPLTDVKIQTQASSSTADSYLDYIDIIYPAQPIAIDSTLNMWFKEHPLDRKISVSGLVPTLSYVFSVDDPFSTNYYPVSGSTADILIPSSILTTSIMVVNESHFKSPLSVSLLPDFTPTLAEDHSQQTDLLIITPEVFKSEAERLATFKENRNISPLTTQVKTYSEIINQFNAGNNDPYAIWHYLSDMYMMAPDPKPQYVLLLGDGHFDYQNKLYSIQNFIPFLYEPNALWPCDDIFVMVNSREDKTNDMAIGRIPANSINEVKYAIDKIIHYDSRIERGEWQLNSLLVADDPSDPPQGGRFFDQTEFIQDSEDLYNDFLPKAMQAKKVYLTEYPERYITELQTTGRDGAREDIMEAFLNGVSFVNYYGHGDPSVWSQEKVFIKNDLIRMKVNKKYPFVLAATCSWGRSDNPDFQSMAEELVTMEENGAIATLAAVRGVFHPNNVKFVQDFATGLFIGAPEFSNTPLMGDAVLYSKISSSGTVVLPSKESNNLMFMYFGDPSIIPAFPQYIGEIDSISRDTLRALDQVLVEGRALDLNGSDPSQFSLNGKITVYDNDYQVRREFIKDTSGSKSSISYFLEGNRLFNGDVEFDGNTFSTQVFIPKDIQYMGKEGKVRIMYWNEDGSFDGAAVIDDIHVGGINPHAANDITGPEITLSSSTIELQNGAIVYDTSKIAILFEDVSGVNITGTSGHTLEMNIDNGARNVDLSELFSYEDNGYVNGNVEFLVENYLDEGEHLIEICAYDNYNNYSEVEIMINVIASDGDVVANLVNFPNPFKVNTDITFSSVFAATASFRVYTISGKKVYDEENISIDPGFNAIPFTAEDEYGHKLAAGVYFYVIELNNGIETIKQHSKMVVLP